MKRFSPWKPYLVWACATLFYIYQFVLRVSPNLIVDDLMDFFHLDASTVGRFSALSMYAYGILQIPAGILADLYGVRRVILTSIVCCILGVALFSLSSELWVAQLGRILLGGGSAAAFLSVSKLTAQGLPLDRRATFLGLTMALGTVGAYLGNTLLAAWIAQWGWQRGLLMTNLFGVIAWIMGFLWIPKGYSPSLHTTHSEKLVSTAQHVLRQLQIISQTRIFWLYSSAALGVYLCMSVIADLWGTAYVLAKYPVVDKLTATRSVALIYIGLCIGSILLTGLADRIQKRTLIIRSCLVTLCILTSLVVFSPQLSLNNLSCIFFCIGFCGGSEMLCFASVCDRMGAPLAGTATGLTNCVVMLGGAWIAEQVGQLLDASWTGAFNNFGIRTYSAETYQYALSALIAVIVFTTFLSFFLPQERLTRKTIS